jgi:hypothetical protein
MRRVAAILCALLILISVGFRLQALGELPGVNGDEAWYGNLVHDILEGQPRFLTPSRIPINPFYIVPLLLGHLFADDSITLLRFPALVSGLAVLFLNFRFASTFFCRQTAIVSITMLAVLPAMIAYSRFGWDMSQMPLATLCIVYSGLLAQRNPTERNMRLAWLAFFLSLIVHPTALFLGPFTFLATLDGLRKDTPARLHPIMSFSASGRAVACCGTLSLLASIILQDWMKGHVLPTQTMGRLIEFTTLFADLFSGHTVFRYLTGAEGDPIIWTISRIAVTIATGYGLWSFSRSKESKERLLGRSLFMGLAAFFVAGGPKALQPGYERYGIFLIVPFVTLWTLMIIRFTNDRLSSISRWPRHVLPLMGLPAAAFALIGFQSQYFDHLRNTGGTAAMTFRTGPTSLHSEVARIIKAQSSGCPTTIITSSFHCEQPLRYLMHSMPEVDVVLVENDEQFLQATADIARTILVVDFALNESGNPMPLLQIAEPHAASKTIIRDSANRLSLVIMPMSRRQELTMPF